jgi:hypothetical protein
MTKTELLAQLREARVGWTTVAQTMDALESTTGRLIDNASEHLSDADFRDLKRVWLKQKNIDALSRSIEILERQQ